jgi:hypothetical protein
MAISTKLSVSGVSEYKKAMTAAAASVREYDSELKLCEAQFKRTGDKGQYLTDKSRILNQQLSAQRQAVRNAKQALAEVSKQYGENSTQATQWRTKLNTARASLVSMKTQLDKTEDELAEMGLAADTSGKSVKDLGSSSGTAGTKVSQLGNRADSADGKVANLGKEADTADDKVEDLGSKAGTAETGVSGLGEKAEDAATDVRALGTKANGANSQVKNLGTAADKADGSVEDLADESELAGDKARELGKQANSAKTKVSGLGASADTTDDKIKKAGSEADTAADHMTELATESSGAGTAMGSINDKLDAQMIIQGIDTITDHVAGLARKAAGLAKQLWEMGTDAGQWADDLLTQSATYGVDVETLQQWRTAAKLIDTDVDIILKAKQKIEGKGANAKLAELGVNVNDTNGQMRDWQSIFWDSITVLHNMSDETARNAAAQDLFGKSYNELIPLINQGREAWDREAAAAPKVAAAQVQALGSVDDSVNKMEATWETLKTELLASMAPALETLADSLTTISTKVHEFLQSEEGQALMQSLADTLKQIVDTATSDEALSGAFETIKSGLESVNGALKWLSEHGQEVGDAIKIITGAFLGLKGVSSGIKIAEMVKSAKGLLGGGAAKAGGAAAAGKGGIGGIAAKSGAGIGLKSLLGVVGTEAAVVAAAIAPAVIAEAQNRAQITAQLEGTRKEVNDTVEEMGDDVSETTQAAADVVNAAADALGVDNGKRDPLGRGVLADEAAVAAALANAAKGDLSFLDSKTRLMLQNGMSGNTGAQNNALLHDVMDQAAAYVTKPQAVENASNLRDVLSDALDEVLEIQDAMDVAPGDNIEALYQTIDKLAGNKQIVDSLTQETQALLTRYYTDDSYGAGSNSQYSDAQALLATIQTDLQSAYDSAVVSGQNVSQGLANGIIARSPAAWKAAENLANGVINRVSAALMIQSPSRVMAQLGDYTGQGFAMGIDQSLGQIRQAASGMAAAAITGTAYAPRPAAAGGGGQPYSVEALGTALRSALSGIAVNMSGEQVGELVSETVDREIGRAAYNARYQT